MHTIRTGNHNHKKQLRRLLRPAPLPPQDPLARWANEGGRTTAKDA